VPFRGDFVLADDGTSNLSGSLLKVNSIDRFGPSGYINLGTFNFIPTVSILPEIHATIESNATVLSSEGMHYVHADTMATISRSSYAIASLGAVVADADFTFSVGSVNNVVPSSFMLAPVSEDFVTHFGMESEPGYIYAKNGVRLEGGMLELSSTSGISISGGTLSAGSVLVDSITAAAGIVIKDTLTPDYYLIRIVSGALSPIKL
jgi:adhesin HecA-like repeat protein